METLIKKILHEEDKVTLNEPLEIGDFIKVIDIGYGEGIHWTRDIKDVEDLSVIGFKRPKLYELYEVIDKGQINTTQEIFYTLLKPEHKKRHETVKGFREGNMMEPLLFPSADMWLQVEENEVLKEHQEKRELDPPIKEGDYIIVIDQDDDRWEPSKTIPRDPSGMSGRANMIESVRRKAPELYTKYEVGEYIPYESRWWPFEIPIWRIGKPSNSRLGDWDEKRLYPYTHTYIKAEDNEILSEERKRKRHAPWMDLDVGDEVVVVHLDKEKMERGGNEIPELYTSYIVVSSHPYSVHNYYEIVDKDMFDVVEDMGKFKKVLKGYDDEEIITTLEGGWGHEKKIIFQGWDDFILREKED